MKSGLEQMRAMSLPRFLGFMVLSGGFAGLFAWLLFFGGAMIFEIDKPTLTALMLAFPRGSLFGIILGLILGFYWNRHKDKDIL